MPVKPLTADAVHGLAHTYKRGCRCDECRAANLAYHKGWAERVMADPAHKSHGTIRLYMAGCRCERCVAGQDERRSTKLAALQADPNHSDHGKTNTYSLGCRCEACGVAARAAAKKFALKHPERVREERRRRHAANPARDNAYARAYQAAAKAAGRDLNAEQAARLKARSDAEVLADRTRLRPDGVKRCQICRKHLPFEAFRRNRASADGLKSRCRDCLIRRYRRENEAYWEAHGINHDSCYLCAAPYDHADHVYPIHRGGPDEPFNLRPICQHHNSRKNAADPEVFFAVLMGEGDALVAAKAQLALADYRANILPRLEVRTWS